MAQRPIVQVEFYGLARRRAGRPHLAVPAASVAEALRQIVATCPQLADVLESEHRLSSRFLLAKNGSRFLDNLDEPLVSGDSLVLLSADAGG
jgi:molybdopterin converting factor small subunit